MEPIIIIITVIAFVLRAIKESQKTQKNLPSQKRKQIGEATPPEQSLQEWFQTVLEDASQKQVSPPKRVNIKTIDAPKPKSGLDTFASGGHYYDQDKTFENEEKIER